jgi:predicted DNA-binding WGR domain protein
MSAVTLYLTDPAGNLRRFYEMDVQPDLFGEWRFIREWGRIGTTGQTRNVLYSSVAQAEAALERQRRRKQRRGYTALNAISRTHSGARKET